MPGQVPTRTARAILPVGLQIAGAPRSDALILDGATVLENILGLTGTTSIDPRA